MVGCLSICIPDAFVPFSLCSGHVLTCSHILIHIANIPTICLRSSPLSSGFESSYVVGWSPPLLSIVGIIACAFLHSMKLWVDWMAKQICPICIQRYQSWHKSDPNEKWMRTGLILTYIGPSWAAMRLDMLWPVSAIRGNQELGYINKSE